MSQRRRIMHIHIGFQCTLPNLQTKPSFSYKHARLRATNTPKAIGKTLSALTAVSGQTPTLNVSLTYPPFGVQAVIHPCPPSLLCSLITTQTKIKPSESHFPSVPSVGGTLHTITSFEVIRTDTFLTYFSVRDDPFPLRCDLPVVVA